MDRFSDRKLLLDGEGDKVPGGRSHGAHRPGSRAGSTARGYTEFAEAEQRSCRQHNGEQSYAGDNSLAEEPCADHDPTLDRPHHDRDEPTRPRNYDAMDEVREGSSERAGSLWPSELGYPPSRGYSPYGGKSYGPREHGDEERGFFARVGDEVRSWFGDRDARRRREQDHRGRT